MRSPIPFALAALAGFGAGFGGMRFMQKGAPVLSEANPSSPAETAEAVTPMTAAVSPVASKERIAAVLALGEKYRDLAEDHALFLAISKLEAPDFLAGADGMLALLKKTERPFGPQSTALAEAWMERWLELDSAGAWRFLESSPFLQELPAGAFFYALANRADMPLGGIFKALVRRTPDQLRAYLAALKPSPMREIGTYLLVNDTAQQDPARAKLLFASLGEGGNRPAALRGYIAGLAESDAATGFATAFAEPAGPLRAELLETVMRGTAKRGVGIVQEYLGRIDDGPLRRKLAIASLQGLQLTSPEERLAWIMEESKRPEILAGWQGEFDSWGSAVGEAVQGTTAAPAADWAAALEGDSGKKVLMVIAARWKWRDPAGLRSWLGDHASAFEPATAEKLGALVGDMMLEDATSTRTWAETLPPGALREQARFQLAVSSGAEGNISQAAEVYESMAASDTSGALAKQLATVFAKRDGAAAAEWALQQPDGAARAAALKTVAEQWSQRDPRGAAEWLTQMPQGAERDVAVREYAKKAVYADAAAAAEWVEQVADPAMRAKAAEQVFGVWNDENPFACRAWLRALPRVDETWRTEFLRKQK